MGELMGGGGGCSPSSTRHPVALGAHRISIAIALVAGLRGAEGRDAVFHEAHLVGCGVGLVVPILGRGNDLIGAGCRASNAEANRGVPVRLRGTCGQRFDSPQAGERLAARAQLAML